MHRFKWLIVIVGGMLFLPWQANVAQQKPSPSGYIVVTLDAIKTETSGPKTNLNLMLASVSGTDSQLQKLTWPTELWQPVALSEELLGDAREAIPLFALPENRMSNELALTLIALDNAKADENFLRLSAPRVLEEIAILTAMWLTSSASVDAQTSALKERLPTLLGENASLVSMHAIKFAKAQSWGVRTQAYEAELSVTGGKLKLIYSVKRVGPICSEVTLQSKLRSLTLHKLGDQKEGGSLYLWARSASSFAASEELLSTILRLPSEKTHTIRVGATQTFNQVLLEGRLGPFVYLELTAWESAPLRRLGSFSGLWLASEVEPLPLANKPNIVVLAPRSREGSGAEVTLDLELSLNSNCRNNAQFVRQLVPATMTAGQRYDVSVTMKNTGTSTWTAPKGYLLGAQNPRDNRNWEVFRVALPSTREGTRAEVPPGSEETFAFTVTAPSTPGTYNFQWSMVQETVEWFGEMTPNVAISVTSR